MALSVAFTVNANVPVSVGVPRSSPEEVSSRPGGSAPDAVSQWQGPMHPSAFSVTANGLVTLPASVAGNATLSRGATMSRGDRWEVISASLLALMVNVYRPTVPAGTSPESWPVEESICSHGGALQSSNVGAGKPVAFTSNEMGSSLAAIAGTVSDDSEVIAGAM